MHVCLWDVDDNHGRREIYSLVILIEDGRHSTSIKNLNILYINSTSQQPYIHDAYQQPCRDVNSWLTAEHF